MTTRPPDRQAGNGLPLAGRSEMPFAEKAPRSVPVAEILESLTRCDAAEFEAICPVLAEHLPSLDPADVPQLAETYVSALHSHLSPGSEATAELLDEVCSSWASVRLLPKDTLSSLLRLLLRNRKQAGQHSMLGGAMSARTGGESAALRSHSSPGRALRAPRCGSGSSSRGLRSSQDSSDGSASPTTEKCAEACPEAAAWISEHLGADAGQLPSGDVRLLQALLRLGSAVSRKMQATAQTRRASQEASKCKLQEVTSSRSPRSLEKTCAPASARRSRPTSANTPRAASADAGAGGRARSTVYHSLADSDSAPGEDDDCSEASLDWCMGMPRSARGGHDSASSAAFQPGCSSEGGGAPHDERSPLPSSDMVLARQTTTPGRTSRVRCRSLPAELKEESSCTTLAPATLGERETQLSQITRRGEYAEIQRNQVVLMQSLRETAGMVADVHLALEAERQERAEMRSQLSEACMQIKALAEGQRQLQQIVTALCLNQGAQLNNAADTELPQGSARGSAKLKHITDAYPPPAPAPATQPQQRWKQQPHTQQDLQHRQPQPQQQQEQQQQRLQQQQRQPPPQQGQQRRWQPPTVRKHIPAENPDVLSETSSWTGTSVSTRGGCQDSAEALLGRSTPHMSRQSSPRRAALRFPRPRSAKRRAQRHRTSPSDGQGDCRSEQGQSESGAASAACVPQVRRISSTLTSASGTGSEQAPRRVVPHRRPEAFSQVASRQPSECPSSSDGAYWHGALETETQRSPRLFMSKPPQRQGQTFL
eukprot:TRINITY_DN74406_c0_g1_i1.p1 TRINITY_DN74406_c0_g1~~TRINITY_DN74406_c0_g1_i1.p1  ORF type:complete len:768 (-),score=132.37 TRINITY_DN74406_c0_g1_i1:71-2374(-)